MTSGSFKHSLSDLEVSIDTRRPNTIFSRDFINSIERNDWEKAKRQLEKAFQESSFESEKGFYVFLMTGLHEINYNYEERARTLLLWKKISNWRIDPLCQFFHTYQKGLSSFFESSYHSSEHFLILAHRLAEDMNYAYGQMIAKFHLGLVYRDVGQRTKALKYLQEAFCIAESRGSGYRHRCQRQVELLNEKNTSINFERAVELYPNKMKKALLENNYALARRAYQQLRKIRIHRDLSRPSMEFYIYAFSIWFLRNGFYSLKGLIESVQDPALIVKALLFQNQLSPLDLQQKVCLSNAEHECSFFAKQKLHLGIYSPIVNGVPVDSISNLEQRTLAERLLEANSPLDMENIYDSVWGSKYDPILHENKIHKLIFDLRSSLGEKKVIVNHRGAYSLNMSYVTF